MSENNLLRKDVTSKHLDDALKFAVDYYINPHKEIKARTSTQERRVGQIMDDWMTGKIIELAVIDILKQINPDKQCFPDLKIHNDPEYEDPDVVDVLDRNSKKRRPPETYVEVKNTAKDDQWTGLYRTQWDTINRHELVNDGDNLYIVYASIKAKESSNKIYQHPKSCTCGFTDEVLQSRYSTRTKDVLGIFLKQFLNSEHFAEFIDDNQVFVEIDSVITGIELRDNGEFFNKKREAHVDRETGENVDEIPADGIWDVREQSSDNVIGLFKTSSLNMIKANGDFRKNTLPVNQHGDVLPLDGANIPQQFGDFTIKEGTIEDTFHVSNRGNTSLYFRCATEVTLQNHLLGYYSLREGEQYRMSITLTGGGYCNRDNLWIAKRNRPNIAEPALQRMKEIAEKI